MSDSIFFSIVMAVRNGDKFISETLGSILNQTYRHFELIVVDDGSTDRTIEIVNQYMEVDNRIRLVLNINSPGLPPALNCGISYAIGQWIARCDADDVWMLEKLQIQADFIQSWQVGEPLVVLGTTGYNINEIGKFMSLFPSSPNTIDEFKCIKNNGHLFMMCHSSVIFNREVFYQIGEYREDYIGTEDCDLWARFSDVGVVINIDRPLFLYRKHLRSWQLENTITQMNNIDRIKENTLRRRNGFKEMGYDEFVKFAEQSMTKAEKKKHFRQQKGKYLYRIGAINLANGRYISGIFHLLLAMPYDSQLVLNNLKNILWFKVASGLSSFKSFYENVKT
jgi:glycosyltransferase involved in cell wall biosynthesis